MSVTDRLELVSLLNLQGARLSASSLTIQALFIGGAGGNARTCGNRERAMVGLTDSSESRSFVLSSTPLALG